MRHSRCRQGGKTTTGGAPASGAGGWVLISDSAGTVDDPGAVLDSIGNTVATDTGVVAVKPKATGVPQVDGYSENVPVRLWSLTDKLPTFDPALYDLDLYLETLAMPMQPGGATAKYGLAAFVVDSAPAAGRVAWAPAGAHVYPNTGTALNGGVWGATTFGSTSGTFGSNINASAGMLVRVSFDSQASPQPRVYGQFQLWNADEFPITAVGSPGTAMNPATLSNWRVGVGLVHFSAVDASCVLRYRLLARMVARRVLVDGIEDYPRRAVSGQAVIAILGDSRAYGTGGAGDVNAGVTLPAGVTVRDAGVNLTAWPSTGGSGPDPGYMPQLAAAALAAGWSSVQIIRRATNGQTTAGVHTTEWDGLELDLAVLGCADPDLIVLDVGANDSQTAESTAFTTRIRIVADAMRQRFPRARLVLPLVEAAAGGSYPESSLVRAGQTAAADARQRVVTSPNTGITMSDSVHPNAAGNAIKGAAIWTAYLASD